MDITEVICFLIVTCMVIGQCLVIFWQTKRIKTLEYWVRRFDEVLDPEGTGDVYIKNEKFREESNGCTRCK